MAGFRTFLKSGHAPTLFAAFLYFDFCFAVWVLNGAMAPFISEAYQLTAAQKGFMVSVPILAGALMRLESSRPPGRLSGSRIAAAATTGPASGPRPASSRPQMAARPARASLRSSEKSGRTGRSKRRGEPERRDIVRRMSRASRFSASPAAAGVRGAGRSRPAGMAGEPDGGEGLTAASVAARPRRAA